MSAINYDSAFFDALNVAASGGWAKARPRPAPRQVNERRTHRPSTFRTDLLDGAPAVRLEDRESGGLPLVVLAAEFKRQTLDQTRWASAFVPLRRLVTGGAFKLNLLTHDLPLLETPTP